MKARLRTKLLGAVVLYVLLLGIVGGLGLSAAQASLDSMHVAIEHHVREVAIVGDLAREVNLVQSTSTLHIMTDSPDERDQYEQQLAQATRDVNELVDELEETQVRFDDQGDIPAVQDFRRAWQQFVRARDEEVLPLSREDRDTDALEVASATGTFGLAYREVGDKLSVLQAQLPAESTERLEDAEREFGLYRELLLAAVMGAALFGIAFGFWNSTLLARAIEALSAAARGVADGDLSRRVRISTGDELESLAESFNTMTTRIDEQFGSLEAEVAERRRVEAALRESEARFRSVTESVNDAIVSTDSNGKVVFWNRGAQTLFGYTEAEILDQPVARVLAHGHRAQFPTVGVDSRRASAPRTFELTGLRKDGSEVPLELSTATWTQGDECFYTATMRDVTERRAVERMKNEFVSMVSHELRTPLGGIIGMTDLLLRRNLDSQERQYAQAVRQSGESLMAIVNDILDFTKIEAGRFELDIGPLDVREVVEDVVGLLAEQAQSKGLEIASVVDPALPSCLGGDAVRLRQILLNLVGNAVKFTHTGEVVLRAAVLDDDEAGLVVRFKVEDSGIGIPREMRGRLFTAFSQGDSSTTRQYGGTGLGLTISKRLAELMGGEVGAESVLGRGSTFWFTARFSRYIPDPAPLSVPENIRGQRVLIVDGSSTSRTVLHQRLSGRGLLVDAAPNGATALERLSSNATRATPFAVALIDCHLPDGDGVSLARTITVDQAPTGCHLLLMTRLGDPTRPEAYRAAGILAVLEKPIRESRLLDALASAIGGASHPAKTASEGPSIATATRSRDAAELDLTPSAAGDSARVLLVEDNPLNQRVTAEMLRELGCGVEIAANGHDALILLKAQRGSAPYELILMDCQMPGMDGFQTTAEIRRHAGYADVPIVAMTASAMADDRARCVAAGMNDYLAKPVTLQQLNDMMKRWLPDRATQEPATSGDAEQLRRSYLDQLRGRPSGNELVTELLAQFRADAPEYVAQLRDGVQARDHGAIQRAAHSLRGSAALIGAGEVESILRQMEHLARAGGIDGVQKLLDDLENALAREAQAMPGPGVNSA